MIQHCGWPQYEAAVCLARIEEREEREEVQYCVFNVQQKADK